MEIKIERDTTLDRLESYYRRLTQAADVDAPVNVILPKALDNYFVGLVPALLQFVITWSRYRLAGDLILDIDDSDVDNLNEVLQNELLFPAIALVWNKSNLYSKNGQTDLRDALKEPLGSIRNLMVRARPFKGHKLLLTSIDHFPLKSGGIPAFESSEGFIDNEANTLSNLRPALESILSFSNEAKREFAEYGRDFIAIIHELYKNTYEWARTDSANIAISPSIRGCLIKFYKKRRTTILHEYQFHKGLREYFESTVHIENLQSEIYFIEISIFDSGLGFVGKYDSIDKTKLTDIDIIKRCLVLHMTSAKGLDKDEKGVGLDRILKVLDKKGFIRIKTNRRCVYRNMITHPYRTVSHEQDLDLYDWEFNSSKKYSETSEVVGVCLTILYPLSTKP
jgi:hypothetical protein